MPESPDLHPLFVQLQTRYPTSGLLTEVVQIHVDRFVVRAIVQLGNMTLATSLATATTVEQAEDQARLRVLALIGIRPATVADPSTTPAELPKIPFSSYGTPLPSVAISSMATLPLTAVPQEAMPPLTHDRLEHTSISSKAIEGEAIAPPVAPPATVPPLSFEPSTLSRAALPLIVYPSDVALDLIDAPDYDDETFEPESLEPESFEPQSFEFEPEPSEPQPFEPEIPVAQEPASNPDELAAKTADQQISKSKARKPSTGKEVPAVDTSSSVSRDLSSLISQIGVEIDRIGWSKRQGSTYLQKTYGKKTRSELTDEELENFLTYLNAQSSAGDGEE